MTTTVRNPYTNRWAATGHVVIFTEGILEGKTGEILTDENDFMPGYFSVLIYGGKETVLTVHESTFIDQYEPDEADLGDY